MTDLTETTGEPTCRIETPHDVVATAQEAMSWRVMAASCIGLMRRNNQDSAFASPHMVGVCDGMGGEAAGDIASMIAARQLWLAAGQPASSDVLTRAVKAADRDIAELVTADPDLGGMGTTMCAAMFDGRQMDFVHIGDSRAYLWRDGELRQLTHDHSFVQQLIDQGHLTPEEARTHPKRSLVLRIVNGTPISRPDRFTYQPKVGDRYLFCSDGVSSFVELPAIVSALSLPSLEDVVDQLVDDAAEMGAPDNVTLVLVEVTLQDAVLDAVAPSLYGAAAAMKPTAASQEEGDIIKRLAVWGVDVDALLNGDDDEEEPWLAAEPEPVPSIPPAPPVRRHWLRRLVITLVVLAVLAGAALGGLVWLRGQYFIGVDNGQAAIFQGVPYRVGPWYLSQKLEQSSVNVSDLPAYYADQVRNWRIRTSTPAAAEQSLATLKDTADACVAARLDPSQAPVGGDCP